MDKRTRFAVRVGAQWIARFTHPSVTPVDKVWLASEGLPIASHCKALVGDVPYLWPPYGEQSAAFIARAVEGAQHVPICDACVPKAPKVSRKRRGRSSSEDEPDES